MIGWVGVSFGARGTTNEGGGDINMTETRDSRLEGFAWKGDSGARRDHSAVDSIVAQSLFSIGT